MLRKIVSSDGVSLATYHFTHHPSFTPSSGSSKSFKIFFSHANGFHGRIFDQTIQRILQNQKISYDCWSIDHRGHGQSTCQLPSQFHWNIFGQDILTVLENISEPNEKIIGVGHSFGAASLLLAALSNPNRFHHLILYEPVLFPSFFRFISSFIESPLAKAALKRRRNFASINAAIENFQSKPPMKLFHPKVLEDYCSHGLRQVNENEWTLCCPPENEAAVFRSGNLHDTIDRLHEIHIPVLLITGRFELQGLSLFVEMAAKRLPNCTFVKWDDLGHLGPLEDPERFATSITEFNESMLR